MSKAAALLLGSAGFTVYQRWSKAGTMVEPCHRDRVTGGQAKAGPGGRMHIAKDVHV